MAAKTATFLYSGIRVRDMSRSLKFYRALGFRVAHRGRMKHGGQWAHLSYPGSAHRLELNYYPKGTRFYTPLRKGEEFDHFGFFAKDLSAWYRQVSRAGAKRRMEFTDGKSRLIYVSDPDGVWLEAFGPAPPRRKAPPPKRTPRGR